MRRAGTAAAAGFFSERVFSISTIPPRKGLDCCLTNGSVPRAAAEVAAKLVVKLVLGADVVAVITLEKRKHEARRAVAALRPVVFDHRILHGMKFTARRESLDGHDLPPREHRQ